MKAIACCIRNRVRQGWHGGNWLAVMEHAAETAGNLFRPAPALDAENRSFLRWIREADDVYFGYNEAQRESGIRDQLSPAQKIAPQASGLEDAVGKAVYWVFIDEPISAWFKEHVLDKAEEHRNTASLGTMFFYE